MWILLVSYLLCKHLSSPTALYCTISRQAKILVGGHLLRVTLFSPIEGRLGAATWAGQPCCFSMQAL